MKTPLTRPLDNNKKRKFILYGVILIIIIFILNFMQWGHYEIDSVPPSQRTFHIIFNIFGLSLISFAILNFLLGKPMHWIEEILQKNEKLIGNLIFNQYWLKQDLSEPNLLITGNLNITDIMFASREAMVTTSWKSGNEGILLATFTLNGTLNGQLWLGRHGFYVFLTFNPRKYSSFKITNFEIILDIKNFDDERAF
jgi:hypothetical protein